MPRTARVSAGDIVYHCINRSNGRVPIFHTSADYQHFESVLEEGARLIGMRLLAYCIMPNHWHLVLFPRFDGEIGEFMRWVTTTHVRQRRAMTETIGYGSLYQGAYKSFPVETEQYLQQLMVYVEQNPLRARLVARSEDWRWSSLWRREKGTPEQRRLLSELPVTLPRNYLSLVNRLPSQDQLDNIHRSVIKGTPFGSDAWMQDMVVRYHLISTTREPGRPRRMM